MGDWGVTVAEGVEGGVDEVHDLPIMAVEE